MQGSYSGDTYHQNRKVGQMAAQAGCLRVSADGLTARTAPAPRVAC